MCVYAFAIKPNENYKFVLIGNRDEFYNRKSIPAHFWNNAPYLIAGIDEKEKGTWLGITTNGKIAFITNYRNPSLFDPNRKSRGEIVRNYLLSGISPLRYYHSIKNELNLYNGFNLIFGYIDKLYYLSNISNKFIPLSNGIHSISNGFLNSNWPKCKTLKSQLKLFLKQNTLSADNIFNLLEDTTVAKDDELPKTGISYEKEKMLSPIFIKSKTYGTVFSYFITVDNNNRVTFLEKNQLDKNLNKFHFTLKI